MVLTKLPMLTRYTACWPYQRSLGSPVPVARCTIPVPPKSAQDVTKLKENLCRGLDGSNLTTHCHQNEKRVRTWYLVDEGLGKVAKHPGQDHGKGEQDAVRQARGLAHDLPASKATGMAGACGCTARKSRSCRWREQSETGYCTQKSATCFHRDVQSIQTPLRSADHS